jgi:iron complex outermembrane recepter protein
MSAVRTGLLGCLVWGILLPSAGGAELAARLSADISAQPLSEALTAFGRQTGLQLIYLSSIAETQHSHGAHAGLVVSAALTQLLEGTGLSFEFLNARTVRIFPALPVESTAIQSSGHPRIGERKSTAQLGLDEVLVTGTRGSEPLSRVPIDMVVWTEAAMNASHVKGIAELAELTPGVVFGASPSLGAEYTDLVIRGVLPQFGTAAGVYVDDVPMPVTRGGSYFLTYPGTFDLGRVEILRGPQSVLLGDHAISGAVRFFPNQPTLTVATRLIRAELGTTEYGDMSYEAGAAVGGPIVTDRLGFRVTGWIREQGGYIDRVDPSRPTVTVEANSNRFRYKMARGALSFAPSANVQVTPSLMYWSIDVHDSIGFSPSLSDPPHGVFRNGQPFRFPTDQTYYLASLKLIARLGIGELSALTSYFNSSGNLYTDVHHWGLELHEYLADVRLSSLEPDARITWVAGAFASKEHSRHPFEGPEGSQATVIDPSQLAGFGEVAVKLIERLSATAGVRIGYSIYESFTDTFHAHASDTWTAPQFGLSCQANDRNLLYLTIAKGYGSGGVNPGGIATPSPYSPYRAWSYEIGSKHDLLQGRLRLATSAFYIDWNNGPSISGTSDTHGAPGRAVSTGADVSAETQIGNHAKAALDVAYTHAYYTQTYTSDAQLAVREGDAVPVSPWNVTASVERAFPLRNGSTISARIEDTFISAVDRSYLDNGGYTHVPENPSVNVLNLRVAATQSGFELAVFLRNALGAHPILYGKTIAVGVSPDFAETVTPRTLSVSATWRQ